MDQTDDLKAFERRMIEIVSSLQPSIRRWRLVLIILILLSLITFYDLIVNISTLSLPLNPKSTLSAALTSEKTFTDTKNSNYKLIFSSLCLHRREISFSISLGLLILAFLFGIHRKVFASSTIIARYRYVLADYNMSCTPDGRLLIKSRPAQQLNYAYQ